MNSYEKDMYIDHSALDVEWLEQPTIMAKYTKLHAEWEYKVELLEEEKGVIKGELDLDIRANPKKYKLDKLEKITEAVVLGAIHRNKKYRKVRKELIEATREKNSANGAIRSAGHKKDALENLVKLYGTHYFAGPKGPRNLDLEVAKKEKNRKIDKGIKIKSKKKK